MIKTLQLFLFLLLSIVLLSTTTWAFSWVSSSPTRIGYPPEFLPQRQSPKRRMASPFSYHKYYPGAAFVNGNVHPCVAVSNTRLSLSRDNNNNSQQPPSSQEPPNVFGESLKLRFTLWAVEFFGIVPPEKLSRQTLEFILNFMKKLGVYDLLFAPYWKDRLEQCAFETIETKPTNQIVPNLTDLQGTTWRLAYTNEFGRMPPSRRMAYLKFVDDSTLQYSFETKIEGWTNVLANCRVEPSQNGNTLTYYFDDVKTERGEEVNGGLYGMQQGTSRTISTAYFDGQIWIDMESTSKSKSKGGGGGLTVYIQEYYKWEGRTMSEIPLNNTRGWTEGLIDCRGCLIHKDGSEGFQTFVASMCCGSSGSRGEIRGLLRESIYKT